MSFQAADALIRVFSSRSESKIRGSSNYPGPRKQLRQVAWLQKRPRVHQGIRRNTNQVGPQTRSMPLRSRSATPSGCRTSRRATQKAAVTSAMNAVIGNAGWISPRTSGFGRTPKNHSKPQTIMLDTPASKSDLYRLGFLLRANRDRLTSPGAAR